MDCASTVARPNITLLCLLLQTIPLLYVYSTHNDDTVDIPDTVNLTTCTVAQLRELVSKKTGLPVSVFRLLDKRGRQMYDNYR